MVYLRFRMYFFRQAGEPNLSLRPPLRRFFPLRARELFRALELRRFRFRPPELRPPKVAGGTPPPGAIIPALVATAPPGITGDALRMAGGGA
jgi:hypothetical protein